jgi:hypothetical protein
MRKHTLLLNPSPIRIFPRIKKTKVVVERKHEQKYVKPKQNQKFFFQKNHKQKTVFAWVATKMSFI